jgi:hypothetical protein
VPFLNFDVLKTIGQKRSLHVAIRYGMTGKFRCPFHYPKFKVPLEAGAPPPQSFDASYAPDLGPVV